MGKKTLFFIAGFIILLGALFSLYGGGRSADKFLPQKSAAEEAEQSAPIIKPAAKAAESAAETGNIHGQAVYDARIALPPQAILNIKLTETAKAKPAADKAALAEVNLPLSGRSPLDWTLPISLDRLEKDKIYNLQAKISGGDTLLFVNAAPTPLEHNHSAYIIRLAKLDTGAAEKIAPGSIIGQNWLAQSLFNKNIEPDSEISLIFEEETKTDPTDNRKYYRVSGSGGCNRYMATAKIDESQRSLQFTPLSAGLMACLPPVLRQEAEFIDMMAKVSFYRLDETGTLTLLNEAQTPLARFIAR